MLTTKRVLIATLCGFAFGVICMLFASSNPDTTVSVWTKWMIIFSRGLTGFTIGISALRMSWWLHGIFIGFIGSIPMAFPVMDRPEIAVGTFVMGVIYGLLTELITTVVFKAKSVGAIA
jgi:hypothetical protein